MFRSGRKRLNEQEELAYSFAPKLYRLAYARLGQREDAEDVVQEAYFKAFAAIGKLRPGSNMESWLTTILLNTIRDHMRKVANTRQIVSLDNVTSETEVLPAELIESKTPESIIEGMETESELTSAISELPEPFLMPLLLRDIQDFTYKEIAACLNVPIGTVMSRLARARDLLRRQWFSSQSSSLSQQPEQTIGPEPRHQGSAADNRLQPDSQTANTAQPEDRS